MCVQSPGPPGHRVWSLAAGRKLSGHPGSFCGRRGGRLRMPQRRGKPGSVTTATHAGQLIKSFALNTPWLEVVVVTSGGESTRGRSQDSTIKGQMLHTM